MTCLSFSLSLLLCQEDGSTLFHQRHAPASEDVTSDEERMVICEEEGDDDVMGEQDATFWVVAEVFERGSLCNHRLIITAS